MRHPIHWQLHFANIVDIKVVEFSSCYNIKAVGAQDLELRVPRKRNKAHEWSQQLALKNETSLSSDENLKFD